MPIIIVRNDITKMKVDAIVNPTNTAPRGGGVNEVIHRVAGSKLLAEYQRFGGCARGYAKIKKAYRLPSKYVIHTVGPVWQDGNHGECDVLASCYRSSLQLAQEYHCETVAFPLIFSGVNGCPKDRELRIATEAICDFLDDHDMTVYLVLFDRETFQIGQELFDNIATYIDQRYVDDNTDSAAERSRWYSYRESTTQILGSEDDDFCIFPPEVIPSQPDNINPIQEFVVASPSQAKEAFPKKKSSPKVKKGFLRKASKKIETTQATSYAPPAMPTAPLASADMQENWNLADALREIDEGFSESLLRLIDQRGMTDAQCYKKANIDRKLFSKETLI